MTPNGATFSWDVFTDAHDVGFEVHFIDEETSKRDGKAEAPLASVKSSQRRERKSVIERMESARAQNCIEQVDSPGRISNHKGSFSVPRKGSIVLSFDNSFSWTKGKTVRLRCSSITSSTSASTETSDKKENEAPW